MQVYNRGNITPCVDMLCPYLVSLLAIAVSFGDTVLYNQPDTIQSNVPTHSRNSPYVYMIECCHRYVLSMVDDLNKDVIIQDRSNAIRHW